MGCSCKKKVMNKNVPITNEHNTLIYEINYLIRHSTVQLII